MKQVYPDMYCWSVFNEDRQIDFNGHLWVREEGNVLFDPVPMIESDLAQLERLGGAAWIVLTNRDHEREAGAFRERTGARVIAPEADAGTLGVSVDRAVGEGEILPGLRAVPLEHGKSPGEIALYWPEREVILAGDLVVGAPVGRLSLLADEKLDDAPAAALECRKLLALEFDAILVGDGHSLVTGAREQLLRCLEARTDIHINHIHADEVPWVPGLDRNGYRWDTKELDRLVGARRLGYELVRLPPGQSTWPFHLHHFGEEMFLVLEGECTLRSDRGSWTVRAGSCIACPPGPSGTHKFTNESAADCVLLALGENIHHDVYEYPDSDKVGIAATDRFYRRGDYVGYWEGESE
ncbi:MAG: cupin domain-containing protein [Gemmatimonadaceae bacterium]|nr:cupin domain-containing protein [Gemmatimonadaceae bacterium]